MTREPRPYSNETMATPHNATNQPIPRLNRSITASYANFRTMSIIVDIEVINVHNLIIKMIIKRLRTIITSPTSEAATTTMYSFV